MADNLFGDLPALPNGNTESVPASEALSPSVSISAPKNEGVGKAGDHFSGLPEFGASPHDPGILANIGAGTNEAVTGLLGAPVDLTTAAINAGTRGINYLLGSHIPKIERPVGGAESLQSLEHLYGGSPQGVPAVTPTEQIARSAARGATSMVLPGGAAKALPELGEGVAGAVQTALASGATPSGVIAGAAGGLGGDLAASIAPEPYKSVAQGVGNVVGGGIGAATVGTAADTAMRALTREAMPTTATAQSYIGENASPKDMVRAGQRIAAASRQSQGLTLAPAQTPQIEGFEPTLGQETGDLGVLAMEREMRNRYRDLFIAHDAANNAALSKAIGNLAPEDASAAAGQFVRAHLDALNTAEQAEQSQLTSAAQQATERLGGAPTATTTSDLGGAIRERLEQIRAPLKTAASQALEAVDPDGNLALPTDTVASSARDLLGAEGAESPFAINSRAGEAAAGPEKSVLQAASQLGNVSSFSDLRALLGQVSAAQRAIRADPSLGAESRPYARMRELRGAIEDAMVNGAERSAATNDSQEIAQAAQNIPADDLQQWERWLRSGKDDWYGTRAGEVGTQTGNYGEGAERNAGTRPASIFSAPGTAGETPQRFGGAEGVPPISQEAQPLTPNFDAEAADRLATANRAYADYKQRFRQGPVGKVMASGNTPNGYRLGDSQVVGQLFRPGPQGGDAVDSLIRAAGSPEAASRVLGDYPAYSLRQAAEKNGILDPAAYNRWIARYGDALAKLPDLQARFGNAAQASQELADSAMRWRQAREEFQDTAFRHYLNVDPDVSPEQAIDRLMRQQNPVAEAQSLMREASTHPDVVQSAQRNAVDWVLGKIRTTAEVGTTGERELSKAALQRVLEGNPAQAQALKIILGPERFSMLERVSDAMDLASRSQQATAIKGSPGTAADVHTLGAHGSPSLLLQAWLGERAGDVLGHLVGVVGGLPGAALRGAGAVGGILMRNARAQGLERIDQLATQGILHPELGRILLGAAARNASDPRLVIIGRELAALGLTGDLHGNNRQRHAHGGAVSVAEVHQKSAIADAEPSAAQKEAGNYRKGHVSIMGLPITIENAKGSYRRGMSKDGKPWAVKMPVPYGYLKRTEGMDDEHIDAFLGPDVGSRKVFVIDQVDADDGKPDEHKVMLGFDTLGAALGAYEKSFSDGRGYNRIGALTTMGIDQFKAWLKHGDTKHPLVT